MFQIKDLSAITGIATRTIHYYERSGVLPVAKRAENGYRLYTDEDVERLNFIRQARQLDLPLSNIAEILSFRDQGRPPCTYVKTLLENKIAEVQVRIDELEQLRSELMTLHTNSQDLPEDVSESWFCQIIEGRDKA